MRIRPEAPDDSEAIHAVHLAAFDNDAVARLPAAARAAGDFVREFSLVADDRGELVGHVLLVYCRLDTEDARVRRVLQLTPLGVVPARQGEGIGSALVRAAIEVADRHGEPLLLVEGAPAYYRRFGFEPAGEIGLVPPEGVPDWAFQSIRLAAYEPTLRGRVTYPAAWRGL